MFSKNSVAGCLPAFLNTEAVTHKCIVRIGLHLWLWTWMSGLVPKLLMIPVCVSGIKLGDSEQEQQMCKSGRRGQRETEVHTAQWKLKAQIWDESGLHPILLC